jgi:asparagine synthase (glutamine-hydrolysing)
VGAYLSGGIDSTYTSALVKRHFNNRLCTFSVAFANTRFDETPFQEESIRALQTDHRTTMCSDKHIGDAFPAVVWHAETPMLRTAPTPLYHLSRLVRESDYKVVLTGEGADEIFAGYNVFKESQVRRFWARQPESTIRPKLLERLYPYIFAGDNEKAKGYLKAFFKKGLGDIHSPVYSHLPRWENTSQLQSFIINDTGTELTPIRRFIDSFTKDLPDNFMAWRPLTRAQYIEIKLFLSNYLLSTQGDRMAMANSVEGRYPFLDYRVIEAAFQLPTRYRLNGLTEKFILKKIARGVIPDLVIDRPKQPYRAPISSSFFCADPPDYVGEMLSDSAVQDAGYFDPQRVSRLVQKAQRNPNGLSSERENMALVGILSTQLLHHQFIKDFPPKPEKMLSNITVGNDPD